LKFCTYFNSTYITYGFTLIQSLQKHCPNCSISVLCLDNDTLRLTNLFFPKVNTISLPELESTYQDLLSVKNKRSKTEYFWTLTPHLIEHVIKLFNCASVTYLDSDQFFFSSPKDIIREINNYSISILPHRFRKDLKYLEIYGRYNVSWVTMKNDTNALHALQWWRNKCIEDCSVNLDKGVVGDQKYLDFFQSKFSSVHDIRNKGCGIAPWNYEKSNDLILYHFQSLKFINSYIFAFNHSEYKFAIDRKIFKEIYKPFIKQVINNFRSFRNLEQFDNNNKLKFKLDKNILSTNEFIFMYKEFFWVFNLFKLFNAYNRILRLLRLI
jgi:hypothetical protein